jgi:hypothetical protein
VHHAGWLNGHGAGWQETSAKSAVAHVVSALRITRALRVEITAASNQHGIAGPALHTIGTLIRVNVRVALGAEGQRSSRGDDG